jgi:TolB-like protein
MADVFISYARATEAEAVALTEALKAAGLSVWRDDSLPAHRPYADVIEEHLRAARAVVVLWSAEAAKSQWVRAEADLARHLGTLVQVNLDGTHLPLPFNQIPALGMPGWRGDTRHPAWRELLETIAALKGGPVPAPAPPSHAGSNPAGHGSHGSPVRPRETLLTVLPFNNLSNDPDLAYFSDGVAEDIIYTVGAIEGLRVIGRTSSFQFRGADKSVGKVAAALGATHVLDGSVRRAGDRVRIHVELVDAATQATLWSDRFDRSLTDIFALQDEIAGAIATALNRQFAPQRAAISVDPQAYDLYLRARAVYAQDLDWEAQHKAVQLLEAVVEKAPDFAHAWGLIGMYKRGEAAAAAARRSLELDPDCPTGLMALAMTKPRFAEHAEKISLARRAYERAPDEQVVAGTYVLLLVSIGHLAKAEAHSAERMASDPLSPLIAGGHAMIYRSQRRHVEAVTLADAIIAAHPEAGYARFIRALIALFDGDIEGAERIAAAAAAAGQPLPLQVLLMFMRTVSAMPPEMRRSVVEQFLTRDAPTSYLVDICLAAAMGERELAFEHLLTTIRDGRPLEFTADNDGRAAGNDIAITTGFFMPNGEPLRDDPRFAEVCVRLGLYDCWRQLGEWPDCAGGLPYDLRAECERIDRALGGARYSPAR